MDIKYITEHIKARYKMDFTNDKEGFDNLIGLTVERKFSKVCAYYLYRLNNITPELLEVLWGENTQQMTQKCFLNIFQRYMAAKKAGTKRSRYTTSFSVETIKLWLDKNCFMIPITTWI